MHHIARALPRGVCAAGLFAVTAACAHTGGGNPAAAPPAGLREVFPGVRVDLEQRLIEVDGHVPIHAHDPEAPHVYLEVIACIPDSKEHEALVVTSAKPSHVHAALLMVGLHPGSPGRWEWVGDELTSHPPTGDRVRIELTYVNDRGERLTEPAWSWIMNRDSGETFPEGDWLFAGSRLVQWQGREFYDADGTGVFIGLTTFGSETLAWPEMISHEASIEEPVWIADPRRTPKVDTPVTIRITPANGAAKR